MFELISKSGNLVARARGDQFISLFYRDAQQAAVLNRDNALWVAGAITQWAKYSGHFDYHVRSPEGNFIMIAEDDLRGFIWYFPLNQGTWIPRSDLMWLRAAILNWKDHFDV